MLRLSPEILLFLITAFLDHSVSFFYRSSFSVRWQWAGPLDLYGKEDAPALHESPSYGEVAGVNTASLSVYRHSTKTRARWAEGFHELNGHVFDLERDGLRQVVLCPRLTMR